ncbi:hypothetical protein ABW19_dt0201091 [Dactylella cylindrospora]|nr:hypothetical protein ABW19_dt0201091 [Dactylella cylindrospora]
MKFPKALASVATTFKPKKSTRHKQKKSKKRKSANRKMALEQCSNFEMNGNESPITPKKIGNKRPNGDQKVEQPSAAGTPNKVPTTGIPKKLSKARKVKPPTVVGRDAKPYSPFPTQYPRPLLTISSTLPKVWVTMLKITTLCTSILAYARDSRTFIQINTGKPEFTLGCASAAICQHYYNLYIDLADVLRPWLEPFPSLNNVVHWHIPRIVGYIYSAGDPVKRFEHILQEAKAIDVELVRILNEDFPIYVSEVIDYYEISEVFKDSMAGDLEFQVKQIAEFMVKLLAKQATLGEGTAEQNGDTWSELMQLQNILVESEMDNYLSSPSRASSGTSNTQPESNTNGEYLGNSTEKSGNKLSDAGADIPERRKLKILFDKPDESIENIDLAIEDKHKEAGSKDSRTDRGVALPKLGETIVTTIKEPQYMRELHDEVSLDDLKLAALDCINMGASSDEFLAAVRKCTTTGDYTRRNIMELVRASRDESPDVKLTASTGTVEDKGMEPAGQ